jgi:hypothetical protein
MPTTYKRLGNSAPGAGAYTQLYQVPASTRAIISSITIANRGISAGSYRIVQTDSGTNISAPGNADFLAFDTPINALDTVTLTLGAVMDTQQKLGVYGSSASMTFIAWGAEIT